MRVNFNIIAVLLFNLALIVGTGYVVFVLNRSPWWFLLCALFVGSISVKSSNDDKKS